MEEKEFTVRDRRIRHEEESGEAAAAETDASAAGADAEKASAQEAGARSETVSGGPSGSGFSMNEGEEAPIDFSAFVFSLARSALIHLGLENHPEGEALPLNLKAAQEAIDILAMLEEKTRGNLSTEENELISKLLYTLRVSYVEVAKSHTPEGS